MAIRPRMPSPAGRRRCLVASSLLALVASASGLSAQGETPADTASQQPDSTAPLCKLQAITVTGTATRPRAPQAARSVPAPVPTYPELRAGGFVSPGQPRSLYLTTRLEIP